MLRLARVGVGIGFVAVSLTLLLVGGAVLCKTLPHAGLAGLKPTAESLRQFPFPGVGRSARRLSASVSASAFSSDGKLLAAALSNTIRIWDTKTGTQVREIAVPVETDNWLRSLSFSPSRAVLVAGLTGPDKLNGRILLSWRVDTGELVEKFDHEYSRSSRSPSFSMVGGVAYSSDGKYLAFGTISMGPGHKLKVVETESGNLIRSFVSGLGGVDALTFSVDGKLAADHAGVPFPRWSISVWDVAAGQELRTYKGCSWVPQNALAFSPDGKTLAAGDYHGKICLWDVRTAEKYAPLRLGHAQVLAVAFSPDGKTLASAASDNTLRIWDVDTGRELRRCAVDIHHFGPGAATFSPGAQMLASRGRDDRTVHLWDVDTCTELQKFTM